MEIVYERCCGLDIHKKTVVACVITPDAHGHRHKELRTFRTLTPDLLALHDWLTGARCTHIAMESTGVYWRPIFNLCEGDFTLLLVNAAHIKAVPGRKTDVRDAEWIADLLQHGLLTASFIPPADQRELRELTRHRASLVEDRARVVNRLQKLLEDANIKLGDVATDILGKSARAMLEALLGGQTDPKARSPAGAGTPACKADGVGAGVGGGLQAAPSLSPHGVAGSNRQPGGGHYSGEQRDCDPHARAGASRTRPARAGSAFRRSNRPAQAEVASDLGPGYRLAVHHSWHRAARR